MHVEITRILTAWIKRPEVGVNALLQLLPRVKAVGGTAQDEKPSKVEIFNDVDDDIVHEGGIVPPSVPALVVVCDSNPRTVDISQINKPGHVMDQGWLVGFGYYGDQGDLPSAIRHGGYVLRAVKQSLVRFNRSDQSVRELNKVAVARVHQVEFQRVEHAVPGSTFLGLLFADLDVLDKAP